MFARKYYFFFIIANYTIYNSKASVTRLLGKSFF